LPEKEKSGAELHCQPRRPSQPTPEFNDATLTKGNGGKTEEALSLSGLPEQITENTKGTKQNDQKKHYTGHAARWVSRLGERNSTEGTAYHLSTRKTGVVLSALLDTGGKRGGDRESVKENDPPRGVPKKQKRQKRAEGEGGHQGHPIFSSSLSLGPLWAEKGKNKAPFPTVKAFMGKLRKKKEKPLRGGEARPDSATVARRTFPF